MLYISTTNNDYSIKLIVDNLLNIKKYFNSTEVSNQPQHQSNDYLHSIVKSEYRHKSEYSTYLMVERIINIKSEYKVNLQFSQLYKLKTEYITLREEYHNHPSCTHFFLI